MSNFPIINKDSIPESLIIVCSESIRNQFIKRALDFDFKLKSKKRLYDVFNYNNFCKFGIVGPLIGSPAATLAAEPFLQKGTKKVIILGFVGSLDPDLNISDFFFPNAGYSDEGTSSAYGSGKSIHPYSLNFQNKIKLRLSPNSKEGIICSTDTPLKEDTNKINLFKQNNASVVDMEYCALCQLCNIYNAELCATFIVSDLINTQRKTSGFKSKETKQQISKAIDVILNNC